jgi:hypothetical protein
MDRHMRKALLALLPLLALAACELSDPVACPDPVYRNALSVSAQDSLSGANVLPGATLVARDGAYTDSLVAHPEAMVMSLAEARAGTYTVTVRQTGYQLWTKTGVKVKKVECGAETVRLLARLKPAA